MQEGEESYQGRFPNFPSINDQSQPIGDQLNRENNHLEVQHEVSFLNNLEGDLPLEQTGTTVIRSSSKRNIIPHIIQKLCSQLCHKKNRGLVLNLCQEHRCSYQGLAKNYKKLKKKPGLRHLRLFFVSQSEEDRGQKLVFREFYVWFMENMWVRYILGGKMNDKHAYTKCKNQELKPVIDKIIQQNPL